MSFYLLLLVVNFACFAPVYALNFREHPNPFEFLTKSAVDRKKLKFLYAKPRFTDPFKINFDFTFVMLMAAAVRYETVWAVWFSALLLAFGFAEILYTAIVTSIFRRPPVLASDISLIKAGLSIAQKHSYWILPGVAALFAAMVFGAYNVSALLFRSFPDQGTAPLALALVLVLVLVPPAVYHWRKYSYVEFLSRTVYSPTLHLTRNLAFGRRLQDVLSKGPEYFTRHNDFKDVWLRGAPSIIVICIESYGSIVHRDPEYRSSIEDLLGSYEAALAEHGYQFASTFSEAPIFAGGSWLSYTSFTYGLRLDDLQLYDALFSHNHAFHSYESLFHVLKRNGYSNVLLCPLGGIDARSIDWAMIERCFRSDINIDFRSLDYRGRLVNYFGILQRYAPPDQYSLNFAYERIREANVAPYFLFFCTLNSHLPWNSPAAAVSDWRDLNDAGFQAAWSAPDADSALRYRGAIRYQLDYILQFLSSHADEDLLVVLFGDHQPPLLTRERMGKQTPVHVIAKHPVLMSILYEHGFVPTLNLADGRPRDFRHEGFLSLFLKGMQAAYGTNSGLEIDYKEHGVALFNEP
jgi:hypothetical protein